MKKEKVYKISFNLILFMFFFIITLKSNAVGNHTSTNSLVITKNIDFQIEVLSSLAVGVEPDERDFGDIQRNSKNIITKEADLKFQASFNEDVQIKVEYDKTDDLMPTDTVYAKYQITPVENNPENQNDKIDVYLKRVNAEILRKGEMVIPITGDIREVGDVKLGEYKKTIGATVYATPINPISNKILFTEGGIK